MPQKPIWSYDVTSPNKEVSTLHIRKLLQKNAQPDLDKLHKFDLNYKQTLMYLYENNEKYKKRTNERVVTFAKAILVQIQDETKLSVKEIKALSIEPHLVNEDKTELE